MRNILLILLLGPFLPRRVAKHTHSAGRITVAACYALGLLLGIAALTWAWFACGLASSSPIPGRGALGDPAWIPPTIDIGATVLALVINGASAIGITGIAVLIALPFAWRDETLRDTLRHAVRTVLLFAPAWMLPTAACYAVLMLLIDARIVPQSEVLLLLPTLTLLPLWTWAIVVGAVSVDRPTQQVEHNPLCETCGYLLHHVPSSRRCPECGSGIAPAINPTYRAIFHPTARIGAHQARLSRRPSVAAWTRPETFFSHVWLALPLAPLLRIASVWFAATAFAAWAGFCLVAWVAEVVALRDVAYIAACVASALVTGVFGLWCVGAGIVGLIASIQTDRNLLRAAFVVAACTSGYFVVWAVICLAGLLTIDRLMVSGGLRYLYWALIGWLTTNTVMALFYVFAVWRRMRYVRYGNWQFVD